MTPIVFFGTGPISRATLEGIADNFTIEAVVTKADSTTPGGKVIDSPVKQWALEHKVPIFQPPTKTELASLFAGRPFASQIGLVVDYGLIIPESVIKAFPLGIVNSHFSLLPQWRGADPITMAISSGAKRSGVSLMLIVPALDEGQLLAQESFDLPPDITISQLDEKLVKLSTKMIQSVVPQYINGSLKPYNQDLSENVSYTKKLQKSDGQIDWSKPAAVLEREIRAYLGWPGSFTTIGGKDVIITKAYISPPDSSITTNNERRAIGVPFKTPDKQLAVTCGDGQLLIIDRLKPAGKRDMTGPEFLAGNPL